MKRTTFKATLNPFFAALLSRRMALSMAALVVPSTLFAGGPTGETVISGTVTVTDRQQTPNRTVVNQSSNSAIVNWNSFDVSTGHTVQFAQPNSSSVILNRVVGGSASQIFGNIEANGRVFIVNPQGVMFGQGSQVDVGGLVASTLDISDSNFTSGNYVFERSTATCNSHCSVQNWGDITVGTRNQNEDLIGGYVVLASDRLASNGGQLIAGRLGDVVLASGNKVTLDLDASGLVSFVVNDATVSAYGGVSNSGDIIARGGMVLMTTHAASELINDAVNNSGRIEARGIEENGGDIFLTARGEGVDDIFNNGTLDVSADEGFTGGDIEIRSDGDIDFGSGSHVHGHSLTLEAEEIYIEDSTMLLTGAFKANSTGGDIDIVGYGGYGGGYGYGYGYGYGGDYSTAILAQTVELNATDGGIYVYGANLGYVAGSFVSQSVGEPGSAGIEIEDSFLQGRASHTFNSGGDIRISGSAVTGAPEDETDLVLGQFSAVTAGDFDLLDSSIFASRIGITGTGLFSSGPRQESAGQSTSGVGSEIYLNGALIAQNLIRIDTTGGIYDGSGSTYGGAFISAGALSLKASEITLNGIISVGDLPAGAGVDPLLLQLVALGAPNVLPSSLSPNVSLTATDADQDGIYLQALYMSGDYLHVQAPSFQIYDLRFDGNLFFNFSTINSSLDTEGDLFFGIISNTLPSQTAASAPREHDTQSAEGLTVALGSSSYAGDILFAEGTDVTGANILYLTTGQVFNADTIVNAERVVDLNAFRAQLSRGETATNTQVTAQLQDSVPTGESGDTGGVEGDVEGDVETKSTKEEEEGELSCS